MNAADRVKETAVVTATTTVTLTGAAALGFRALAAAISASDNPLVVGMKGVSFSIVDPASGKWLDGYYTITSATTLTRESIAASSAAGADVDFAGATCEIYNTVFAADLLRVARDRDVAFSQSVPLDQVGIAWMTQQTVAAKYVFTPAASAVKGAVCALRLKADGVTGNAPDVSAFRTIGGSSPYNNVANSINLIEFAYDGTDYWVAISLEGSTTSSGGTSGADTTLPAMSGSLASSSITTGGFTLTWSAATDNVGVTAYEVSTNGGASYTNIGNVLTWTASGLTANTPYSCSLRAIDAAGNRASPALTLTVTTSASSDTTAPTMSGAITASSITQNSYTLTWPAGSDNVAVTGYEYSVDGGTSYTNVGNVLTVNVTGRTAGAVDQVRVRDYDAAGLRGTPLSASVTLLAATAPGAPTIGAAVAGDGYVDVAFTAPASNGGATITGYTATLSTGETNTGTTSPIRVTAANGTARTAHVTATNSAGTSSASAESNSVTPVTPSYPRLTSLSATTTESGTGPYTYTGGGAALGSETGGISSKSIPANTDGWIEFVITAPNEVIVGFRLLSTASTYTNMTYSFYASGVSGSLPAAYRYTGSGILSTTPQAGDRIRVIRTGNVWKFAVARAATPTTFVDVPGSSLDRGSAPQVWLDAVCSNSAAVQLTAWSGFV